MAFLRLFGIFTAFSTISLFGIFCAYIDIQFSSSLYIAENSVTELMQSVIIFAICTLYACSLKFSSNFFRLNILVLGFFVAIFFRELDGFLDKFAHGSWLYAALFVSIIAIFFAFKEPKRLKNELANYIQTKAFDFMLFGLCLVLVFGRIFGTGRFWEQVFSVEVAFLVKNIVQEVIEFLGYTLCLLSAIIFNIKQFKGKK